MKKLLFVVFLLLICFSGHFKINPIKVDAVVFSATTRCSVLIVTETFEIKFDKFIYEGKYNKNNIAQLRQEACLNNFQTSS